VRDAGQRVRQAGFEEDGTPEVPRPGNLAGDALEDAPGEEAGGVQEEYRDFGHPHLPEVGAFVFQGQHPEADPDSNDDR